MIENYDKLLINDILISFFTLDRDAYSDNTVNLNANNEQNMKNKYKIDLNNDVQMIVDYDCFSILFSKEKKILLLSKIYRDNYYTIKDNWACLSLELDDDTFEKYKKIGASVYIKTDSCLEGIKYQFAIKNIHLIIRNIRIFSFRQDIQFADSSIKSRRIL